MELQTGQVSCIFAHVTSSVERSVIIVAYETIYKTNVAYTLQYVVSMADTTRNVVPLWPGAAYDT